MCTSDWVKPKASPLIVFNDGRHTTELMRTKNLLHKSHSNNEQPKKGIGGGTIFFEDASYTSYVIYHKFPERALSVTALWPGCLVIGNNVDILDRWST